MNGNIIEIIISYCQLCVSAVVKKIETPATHVIQKVKVKIIKQINQDYINAEGVVPNTFHF